MPTIVPCSVTGDRLREAVMVAREAKSRRLCQSKIEQFYARRGKHDVAGLEVTMDDSAAVGFVQRVSDLDSICRT